MSSSENLATVSWSADCFYSGLQLISWAGRVDASSDLVSDCDPVVWLGLTHLKYEGHVVEPLQASVVEQDLAP